MKIATVLAVEGLAVVGSRFWGHKLPHGSIFLAMILARMSACRQASSQVGANRPRGGHMLDPR